MPEDQKRTCNLQLPVSSTITLVEKKPWSSLLWFYLAIVKKQKQFNSIQCFIFAHVAHIRFNMRKEKAKRRKERKKGRTWERKKCQPHRRK